MNRLYKVIPLFALFILVAFGVFAQQNHFIYLQTENKQPFYVKFNNKLLSSSASGYLIIPKLQEGNHQLAIGFPKNEWPEQNISCTVNKKDAGYLLKDFGDKGWGLFNLQTMELLIPGSASGNDKAIVQAQKKEPGPIPIPSSVIADSVIAKIAVEKPIIKEEAKPGIEIVKTDTVKPAMGFVKVTDVKSITPIAKLISANTTEGAEMVYVDMANGKPDTVIVFIPAQKDITTVQVQKKTEEVKVEEPKAEKPKAEEPKVEIKKGESKPGNIKFIDITLTNPNAKTDTGVKQIKPAVIAEGKKDTTVIPEKQKENITKLVIANSDCKKMASEDDFLKLRKKMAAETTNDDMINVAKKFFKAKCYTTYQVKNLSVLFLNDGGKYQFFDAAYFFVSDSYNFGSLETLLTDNYFITRFKAMIRH
jgi:hypothetical protein